MRGVQKAAEYREEGNGTPFQYSCLENPMGGRSLVGSHPWGCEEVGHD